MAFDSGNIVSISGNIFLYPLKKFGCHFVCLQTALTECAHALSDHSRALFRSHIMARAIIILLPSLL